MDIDTDNKRPIEKVVDSINDLTEQMKSDLSDIKEDIAFIKKRIEEKEQEEDKYKILDNNREPEVSKGWFW
jgi:hypothetical protein